MWLVQTAVPVPIRKEVADQRVELVMVSVTATVNVPPEGTQTLDPPLTVTLVMFRAADAVAAETAIDTRTASHKP